MRQCLPGLAASCVVTAGITQNQPGQLWLGFRVSPLLISPPHPPHLSPHPPLSSSHTYSPTKPEGGDLGTRAEGPGTEAQQRNPSLGVDLAAFCCPGAEERLWLPHCITTLRRYRKAAVGPSCEPWKKCQGPGDHVLIVLSPSCFPQASHKVRDSDARCALGSIFLFLSLYRWGGSKKSQQWRKVPD